MELLYRRCAGMDVHKKLITVCLRLAHGATVTRVIREFSTMTRDLLALLDWLIEHGITHVVMESTGSYWKPVYNILEGSVEILLANAQHLKTVPGRKTDVKDSEWLADLHAHGLLRASFVPNLEQRGIRELTRTRSSLVGERARLANRVQKILEDANIKLCSVATDVLGVSCRQMLEQIMQGDYDPKETAELAQGRMRPKIPALELALEGRVQPHHRIVLRELLAQVDALGQSIDRLDREIVRAMEKAQDPFESAVEILDTTPGVAEVGARAILAEMGTDMNRFPTPGHLASWSGECPGNKQSGGKRLSGRTTHGNSWLRKLLNQAAHAAVKVNGCYLQGLYRRLAPRIGKKRAIIAVAHSMLVAFWHMLKNGVPYQELGANYFDEKDKERVTKRLRTRLENLGYQVELKAAA